MPEITLQVPDELEKYRTHLYHFVDGMIAKLYKNRHKDAHTLPRMGVLVDLLKQEIVEFEEQLEANKWDTNSLRELMDTSNFAFLAYCVLREEGVGDG